MDWRPRAEHVWVADIALGGDRRAPGLLLGWRRGTTAWCGWCVIATPGIGAHGDGPYTQLRWVDAAAIIPLDPRPPGRPT